MLWEEIAHEGGFIMPEYQFVCKDCKKRFTLRLSVAEYVKQKAKCPKCSSRKVDRRISAFSVQTSKKS